MNNKANQIFLSLISLSLIPLSLTFSGLVGAATSGPNASPVDLDNILKLLQLFLILGGGFIAAVAALGIWVFGFDVRRTRNELDDARKEINEKKNEVLDMHRKMQEMLAETRAQKTEMESQQKNLESFIADTESDIEHFVTEAQGKIDSIATEVLESTQPEQEIERQIDNDQDDLQAIRQVIQSSSFKWTSIKRIANKTGLERNTILTLARHAEDMEISVGRDSKDHIFRILP